MSNAGQLQNRLVNLNMGYQRHLGQKQAVENQAKEYEDELEATRETLLDFSKVLSIFHVMTDAVHAQFLEVIEGVITSGLEAVFNEPIEFRIVPTIRGKNVNFDFVISGDGGSNTDLMSARGGGVVSVIGVLLRVLVVRLLRDRVRQVVILDEPLAMLSEEYVEPMGLLLSTLAADLGMQIILVSHQPGFANNADVVYTAQRTKAGTKFV